MTWLAVRATLSKIPAWAWMALAGVIILLLAGYGLYRAGYGAARVETLERSVEVLRGRKTTNENIRNLDDAGLCSKLDGVWRNGECL
ncbi:hypothetical protein HB779_17320 [Phyllobacterium sp. 628]|uniref:hypothetical protein n=1 Tax=Phyllobacterium sp. 628 TaxID=2718938 RepID=UPI0016623515|nr:hypothetical protein [Phyllobacterium sp. 628]QND53451.1 hypothetical protein HB779_17320 [Phyllobacterium sp. 628]